MDERGISVRKLAKASGLPLGTVSTYLLKGEGSRLPTYASVVKISKALGVDAGIWADCEDFQDTDG
jgi:transcriptional regulator with XRE-family HTH domain